MRIAICDDDKGFAQELKDLLLRINGGKCLINLYSTGTELLDDYDRAKTSLYDLVFVDIEMPGLNGILIADELKKIDMGIIIIIITNFTKYAYQAFDVRVFNYIWKPLMYERVETAYLEAITEISSKKYETFPLNKKDGLRYVRFLDVYYIESFKDKVIIHTYYESICYTQTLLYMQALTAEHPFFKIHKSYLAHLGKIAYIDKSERLITLLNNEKLPYSKDKTTQANFFQTYARYKQQQILGAKAKGSMEWA